jgi:hypothetical protein
LEKFCNLIAAIVASVQEAIRVMQYRGVHIDAKKICEIARRYARRTEFAQQNSTRRVVNLRLKGASIYWLAETAEAMLPLRSFY